MQQIVPSLSLPVSDHTSIINVLNTAPPHCDPNLAQPQTRLRLDSESRETRETHHFNWDIVAGWVFCFLKKEVDVVCGQSQDDSSMTESRQQCYTLPTRWQDQTKEVLGFVCTFAYLKSFKLKLNMHHFRFNALSRHLNNLILRLEYFLWCGKDGNSLPEQLWA